MTANANFKPLNRDIQFPLPHLISNSKPYMWVLLPVWLWWSCIAARRMGKPVLSAAWPGTLTAPGTEPCARDTWRTANDASAGRTSDMETLCCSVPIRIWAVSSGHTHMCTHTYGKSADSLILNDYRIFFLKKGVFILTFMSLRGDDRQILLPISRVFP